MSQPFIGQIIAVGFNFTPVGWLPCQGQLVSISQYDVLFALIGTIYGGDGVNTFGIPNLNGRTALNVGQGPGRSNYSLGEMAGTESVTLTSGQAGAHTHPFLALGAGGTTNVPGPTEALAANAQSAAQLYAPPPATVTMSPSAIAPSGGNGAHENRQPYQAINYIICVEGIFPARN